MKVFFDSNIYVSAAVYGGVCVSAVDTTIKAKWKVYASPTTYSEMRRVISQKLKKNTAASRRFMARVRENTTCVSES